MLIDELIIYRQLQNEDIIKNMCMIMDAYSDNSPSADIKVLSVTTFAELIRIGEEKGFYGNLWADYLTDVLVNDENAYAKASEIGGNPDGSISEFMIQDMKTVMELYSFDISGALDWLGLSRLKSVIDYQICGLSKVYNTRIRDRICMLANDMIKAPSPSQAKGVITSFYKQYGVGKLGLHKAFRVEEDKNGDAVIVPILKIAHVSLDDIIGYESAKQKLIANTEAFVGHRPANNCLLYGEAGTGKSSSIKAISNEYYDDGLRIIEVYRHQFRLLNDIISQIKDRNYRFIIYMDDLSFEDFETEYKYLKAVIEGGLEKKPDNVLIYATSNRRHLIRETVSDRDDYDPDMHKSDTVSEKLSLSYRFGESIYFGSPDKKQFNNIVIELAKRDGIDMPEEQLLLEANKWELYHGGLSGRTARQFIDHLLGMPER